MCFLLINVIFTPFQDVQFNPISLVEGTQEQESNSNIKQKKNRKLWKYNKNKKKISIYCYTKKIIMYTHLYDRLHDEVHVCIIKDWNKKNIKRFSKIYFYRDVYFSATFVSFPQLSVLQCIFGPKFGFSSPNFPQSRQKFFA